MDYLVAVRFGISGAWSNGDYFRKWTQQSNYER